MNPGAEFDDFVRRASPQLLRTSFLLVRDRGHAEDLLQEALVRTARHWHTAGAAPEAYTRRVIVNLAADRWRARQSRPVEVPLPDTAADRLGTAPWPGQPFPCISRKKRKTARPSKRKSGIRAYGRSVVRTGFWFTSIFLFQWAEIKPREARRSIIIPTAC